MTGDTNTSSFTYDCVLPATATQADVFATVSSITEASLRGQNGTIITYGQTGGGKTHTLIGNVFDPLQRGVVPRAASQIFNVASKTDASEESLTVRVSAVEIYCERIRDLLCFSQASENLTVQQDKAKGMFIAGAQQVEVKSEDELLEVIQQALKARVVAATGMNAGSSRSHCLVFLYLQRCSLLEPCRVQIGKLCLIDLAGSERQDRTLATNLTLEEGKLINKGLSALGNVVNALLQPKKASSHIPYRDSKLTRVLQDSLGGNANTALIVCCSPSLKDASESLAALRFANRASKIVSTVQVLSPRAEKPTPEAMQQLQHRLQAAMQEITALKKQLALVQEQQSSPTENYPGDVKSPTLSKEKQLSQNISAMLRTLFLLSVLCIATADVFLR